MNKPHLKISSLFLPAMAAIFLIGVMASCGSGKKTVAPPRSVTEVPLSALTGKKSASDAQQLKGDAASVVKAARSWLGTRYQYGGTTRDGIDCSALIMHSFREGCNIKLPRTSAAQRQYSAVIQRSDLLPGDLVFFTSRRSGPSVAHVGLYIGDGRIIHASSSRGVIISKLTEAYYMQHYHSAGRVLKPGKFQAEVVAEVASITPEILRADSIAELQAEMLDMMLNSAIDSIYANDPF